MYSFETPFTFDPLNHGRGLWFAFVGDDAYFFSWRYQTAVLTAVWGMQHINIPGASNRLPA
jgi:hypothetical protein